MFKALLHIQLLGSMKAWNSGAQNQGTISKAIFFGVSYIHVMYHHSKRDDKDNLNNYFAAGEMLQEPILGDPVSAIYTR